MKAISVYKKAFSEGNSLDSLPLPLKLFSKGVHVVGLGKQITYRKSRRGRKPKSYFDEIENFIQESPPCQRELSTLVIMGKSMVTGTFI